MVWIQIRTDDMSVLRSAGPTIWGQIVCIDYHETTKDADGKELIHA